MRKVTSYPESIKESLLAKALAPNAPSVVTLAKEFNIPYATIHTWIRSSKKQTSKQMNTSQRPQDKSAEAKLQAVFDTMNKPEAERGAYCRAKGIYTTHLDSWRQQALESLGNLNTKQDKSERQKMANENKKLKSELQRKDRALAEVSALLILKKKADVLWGGNEDD